MCGGDLTLLHQWHSVASSWRLCECTETHDSSTKVRVYRIHELHADIALPTQVSTARAGAATRADSVCRLSNLMQGFISALKHIIKMLDILTEAEKASSGEASGEGANVLRAALQAFAQADAVVPMKRVIECAQGVQRLPAGLLPMAFNLVPAAPVHVVVTACLSRLYAGRYRSTVNRCADSSLRSQVQTRRYLKVTGHLQHALRHDRLGSDASDLRKVTLFIHKNVLNTLSYDCQILREALGDALRGGTPPPHTCWGCEHCGHSH